MIQDYTIPEERIRQLKALQAQPQPSPDPMEPTSKDRQAYLMALQGATKQAPNKPETPKETMLEKADRAGYQALMGPAEGIANIGTGVAGWMAGKGAGIAKLIYDTWKTGGRGSWEDAEEAAQQVAQKVSSVGGLYQPQTQMGKDLARTVALPWEVGNKVIGQGAEAVSDDPETQAGIKYVGEILLGLLGGKAVHGAGKSAVGKVRNIVTDVPASKIAFPTAELGIKSAPVQQMIQAIKEFKPLRKEQEALYTKERSQRFGKARGVGQKVKGEAGYQAELSQLKGELKKVEFEPIREAFSQEKIDFLFNKVNDNILLSWTDTLSARKGLSKLFAEEGAKLPTTNELFLLSRVFGKEFTSAVRKKWTTWKKIKHGIFETVNIPRSLMASFDLSAPFRQGLMMIGRKEFYSAFKEMFGYFSGKKSYQALLEDIAQRETYPLMQRSRLDLTEMGAKMGKREERFMSHWGEKIPIGIGKGVEASGRAYAGFLNKVRADVFDSLIKDAERLGLEPKGNPKLTHDIASYINSATGRGRLPVGDEMGTFLNSFFFSPRLVKARLDFMNPGWYMKLDPFARKQAIKSLLTVTGAGVTTLGLAKLAGAEVGDDPRSTDFGKIKIGNTRIDIWGGFQQYAVLGARLISGETVSSTTGKVSQLGKGYKPNTRLGVLGRTVEYKEAPVFSFATTLLKGQGAMGEDLKIEKEALDRLTPMVIQDIVDIYKDDPSLLPLSALGVYGMGLQTYEPKKGIVR